MTAGEKSVTVHAHAKVNLALEVTGRRPDGFHDIATVFAAVTLYDTVRVFAAPYSPRQWISPPLPSWAPQPPDRPLYHSSDQPESFAPGTLGVRQGAARYVSSTLPVRLRTGCASGSLGGVRGTISVHSEGWPVPRGVQNLCYRAAAEFLRRVAIQDALCIKITVVKRIPPGGGMGGGSSDAAAVIRALEIMMRSAFGADPVPSRYAPGTSQVDLPRPPASPHPPGSTLHSSATRPETPGRMSNATGASADRSRYVHGTPAVPEGALGEHEQPAPVDGPPDALAQAALDAARAVGSDVPFFLGHWPVAFGSGRGDILEPIRCADGAFQVHLVVAYPGAPVSTAWAYSLLRPSHFTDGQAARELQQFLVDEGFFTTQSRFLRNTFFLPVTGAREDIAQLAQRLLDLSAAASTLAGSGACVWGTFSERTEALQAAERLRTEGFWAHVCKIARRPLEIAEIYP